MKKAVVLLMVIGLVSCDFMFKKRTETTTDRAMVKVASTNAQDIDKHGCVGSAGYFYSKIQKKCIRAFEEGYRLEAIAVPKVTKDSTALTDATDTNAYVIFDEENSKAELFIPGVEESIVLEKNADQHNFQNTTWTLQDQAPFVLKRGQQIVYQSARPVLKKIIGTTDGE